MPLTVFIFFGVVLFVLVEGFFSGSETAITSADRVLIQDQAARGDARAGLLMRLTRQWEKLLGTTLVGTNLAVVCSTTLADLLISRWCPPAWQSLVNTALMTPFVLLFGELLPKSIGRGYANELAPALARPLHLARIVLYPLVWTAGRLAGWLADLFGHETTHRNAFVSRDDLRILAEIAREEGLLDDIAGDMLRMLFELDQRPVSTVMVHLVDVAGLDIHADVTELRRRCAETGFTRFPVYEGRVDNIVGIVDAHAVLCDLAVHQADANAKREVESKPITAYLRRDVAFVPETKSVAALLHEMRHSPIPMAVVVDEHGGTVGIVTLEDLLEEVVGDIVDERDLEEAEIQRIDQDTYECDGRLDIRKLCEILGITVESDGFETAAGLILKHAGHIPRAGESLDIAGYRVQVLAVEGRRITRLRFRRLSAQPESEKAGE